MFTAIFGKKQSGKSYFVKQRLNSAKRLVIIDPNGEYVDDKGYRVKDYESFLACVELFKDDDFKILITVDDDNEQERILWIVYKLGNCKLIVDEAHLCEESFAFAQIVRRGAHRRIELVAISHSAFDVLRIHRSLFDNIIVFKLDEPFELNYVKRLGYLTDEQLQELSKLNVGQYKVVRGQIPNWLRVNHES